MVGATSASLESSLETVFVRPVAGWVCQIDEPTVPRGARSFLPVFWVRGAFSFFVFLRLLGVSRAFPALPLVGSKHRLT